MLAAGCTPSMNLAVDFLNIDTSETFLQLHFTFERKVKDETRQLPLDRVWIYKDECLVIDMEQKDHLIDPH